ncbi:MAG: type II secretion system minor pseudopilin GspI [Gammaproteobacteria bacterium]|nr:type II secretion system minor pseudopilin GspI [Gammaproteobacteria bacterium]
MEGPAFPLSADADISKSGFTLIELMVALAIVAIVATAVLVRGGETAAQTYSIERRALARWVAENEIERVRLGQMVEGTPVSAGTDRRRVNLGSREWLVVEEILETDHPLLWRAEYSVFALEGGREVGPLDTLTAFIGQH